ncbi:Tll0287-like domain-containing protein [Ectothiorhodospira variabilis]|uniref:Tll0287-like domain-containing protein n=1 Tax=Ectothiorhodospira variabilis TaxID=505694 RepID=UPI001EFBD8BB|nr:DUF3365 domain-containing protein [Ectothiorhodospira variabilis]MCG5493766.1 DUF3365 domain-containing protein [Ectothiorhodospira variabilis]MCG5503965.1 DUF3365 domain-containing protein [Ectothiorhodospira variabilis]MCG5507120.1 DUF3365 domain-containing protein [Ectothiorhodospira variabilis]
MRQMIFPSLALAAMALTHTPLWAQDDTEARLEQARGAVQQFAQSLQNELKTAVEEGGPVHAIDVCSQRAPEIAQEISDSTGIQAGRTSLQLRNPDNAPDDWERDVLNAFEERLAAGEDPRTMEHHEVREDDGGWQIRYMRAIPAGELCMTCHGTEVRYDVEQALLRKYPDDQATGYSEGQIRGAFTLVQPM